MIRSLRYLNFREGHEGCWKDIKFLCAGEVQPNVAELALKEVLQAQAIWRRQLPFGSLEMNSSHCTRGGPPEGLQSRCDILKGLLPIWG
eukprot:s120_g36.t1